MLVSEMGIRGLFLQSGYLDSLEFIKSEGEGELGEKVIGKRGWGGTAAGTEDV